MAHPLYGGTDTGRNLRIAEKTASEVSRSARPEEKQTQHRSSCNIGFRVHLNIGNFYFK